MTTLNVELSDSTYQRLSAMADQLEMPVPAFLEHLAQPTLRLKQPQLSELEESIAEADAGKFATDQEVQAAFDSFLV